MKHEVSKFPAILRIIETNDWFYVREENGAVQVKLSVKSLQLKKYTINKFLYHK